MIWAIPIEVGQDGWSDRAATGLGHSGDRIRVRIDQSDTTYQVGASLGAPGRPGLRPLDSGCNLRLWLLARQELVSQLGIVSEESALNPHYGCVISDWEYAKPYLSDDFVTINALSTKNRSFNFKLNERYGEEEIQDIINAVLKVEKSFKR